MKAADQFILVQSWEDAPSPPPWRSALAGKSSLPFGNGALRSSARNIANALVEMKGVTFV